MLNELNFIDRTDDWSLYLNIIMYQYNTTANSMTTFAPSEIIFGKVPTAPKPIPVKDLKYNKPLTKEYIRFITNRLGLHCFSYVKLVTISLDCSHEFTL